MEHVTITSFHINLHDDKNYLLDVDRPLLTPPPPETLLTPGNILTMQSNQFCGVSKAELCDPKRQIIEILVIRCQQCTDSISARTLSQTPMLWGSSQCSTVLPRHLLLRGGPKMDTQFYFWD